MIPTHNPLLRRSFLWLLPCLFGFISSISLAQPRPEPFVAELGGNFASGTTSVSGVKMYYVRGGDGPAVDTLVMMRFFKAYSYAQNLVPWFLSRSRASA